MLALVIAVVLVPLAMIAVAWVGLTKPTFGRRTADRTEGKIDPARLEADVRRIVELGPRDYSNIPGLERVGAFIADSLKAAGGDVAYQPYLVGETTYNNITAQFGPDTAERIVVGAHYDTAGPMPGADDNASGVAGVLALARKLGEHPLPIRIELVAYCLEEPPYFRTPSMGSAVHARALKDAGVKVRAMFSLEMLGYYDSAPKTQNYPIPPMRLAYPSVADFISVVGTVGQSGLSGRIKRAMRAVSQLPVYSITAPRAVPGVDFSDHGNYWDVGYPAVMITDTSFFRNHHYHGPGDTPDTLDYERMAYAVRGVWNAVIDLAG